MAKNLPASAGDASDLGSIPESRRSSGGGNCNPLQYSCLENPMDRGAWKATVHRGPKSQRQLSLHTSSREKQLKQRGKKGNRLKAGTWPIPGTESIKIQIVPSLPFEPSQDPTQQLFSLVSEKVFSSLFCTIKGFQNCPFRHLPAFVTDASKFTMEQSLHPGITLSE